MFTFIVLLINSFVIRFITFNKLIFYEKNLLFSRFYFLVCIVFAQEDLPKDYLTKEFHAGRRDALRSLMPANSVAVIFSYPVRTFSEDVDYPYHQNPDLYYFSGYKEPNAVLLIFKENQTSSDSKIYNEIFFIQKRDPLREIWTGRRLGVEGVKSKLGFNMVFEGSNFKSFPLDFSKFDKIIFDELPRDIKDDPWTLLTYIIWLKALNKKLICLKIMIIQ